MNTIPDPRIRPNETAGAEDPSPEVRRMILARRIAKKHGIVAATDAEMVAALRARGIDPFEPANMLQVVAVPAEGGSPNLPGRLRPVPADAPQPADPATRAAEIGRIQREIVQRRRRRGIRLATRLAVLVGLPTLLVAFYYFQMATPLYATHSELVIQQAEAPAVAGAQAGAVPGAGGAQQDSIAVQAYLSSRDALARLDADMGFAAHFTDPAIDAFHRLEPGGTREEVFRLYKRMVSIGFDPSEGVVRMDVLAADPEVSAAFSEALIGYAEEQVDALTARLRADQMSGAEAGFAQAEARMMEAQDRVVALQERLGVVSAEAEVSNSYTQIAAVEGELREARSALDRLLSNARPQAARVDVARGNVTRLEDQLATLRGGLTQSRSDDGSLARATAELQVAQQDLTTRQLLLQQAAQQFETARIEANRQVRYLSTPVPPIAPDEATHPRAFQNTVLAFLIFAGAYLMISLTAAILREQA